MNQPGAGFLIRRLATMMVKPMQPKPIADTGKHSLSATQSSFVYALQLYLPERPLPTQDEFARNWIFRCRYFSNIGAIQIAALANTVRFKKPRRPISVLFTLSCFFFISYLFNCQLYVCKNTVLNLSARYQYHGIKDQFYRSTYNICENGNIVYDSDTFCLAFIRYFCR